MAKLKNRIFGTTLLFLAWFFVTVILSYFLLPEGILRSANEAKDVAENSGLFSLAVSIFLRNIIPAVLLALGCLVAIKIKDNLFPFALLGLFTMFTVNGVTLGTWSFSSVTEAAPSLAGRLLRSFDLLHRSGLWEMVGLCLIVAALTNIALIQIEDGKPVFKKGQFKKGDLICLIFGIVLLVIAAFIEAGAVIKGI